MKEAQPETSLFLQIPETAATITSHLSAILMQLRYHELAQYDTEMEIWELTNRVSGAMWELYKVLADGIRSKTPQTDPSKLLDPLKLAFLGLTLGEVHPYSRACVEDVLEKIEPHIKTLAKDVADLSEYVERDRAPFVSEEIQNDIRKRTAQEIVDLANFTEDDLWTAMGRDIPKLIGLARSELSSYGERMQETDDSKEAFRLTGAEHFDAVQTAIEEATVMRLTPEDN